MKGKRNRSCVVLLCLCLASPISAVANDADDESFSNIFVFGNSLSDTGNLARAIDWQFGRLEFPLPEVSPIGLCNPFDIVTGEGCADLFFRQSRVSNGPVAVEVSTRRFGLGELQPSLHPLFLLGLIDIRESAGTNFAVAGATARGDGLDDLGSQVLGFQASVGAGLFDDVSDALYVVFIGGNDVIDAADAALAALAGSASASVGTPEGVIASAVDAIAANIELLIGVGARNILVVNAPNIGAVPAIETKVEGTGVPPALLRGFATLLTIKFNRQLAERVGEIGQQQEELGIPVEIEQFNLFRFFGGVRLVGALFGLNVVDRCFNTDAYRNTGIREFHPDCAPDEPDGAPKFDRFVFFDDIHPTGLVGRLVGNALFKAAGDLTDD